MYYIQWVGMHLAYPPNNMLLKTGTHPAENNPKKTFQIFDDKFNPLVFSYDWSREINTTDESYYRWTQWIFLAAL